MNSTGERLGIAVLDGSTLSPWTRRTTPARGPYFLGLLTPARLKEKEEFIWRLAERQLDEFIANGQCEFLAEYAKPFSTLVIADLLGVP